MRDLICDLCKNKQFSSKKGIICGLTMEKPTVRYTCDFYEKDELLDKRYDRADDHAKHAEFRKNEFNINEGFNPVVSFWSNVLLIFRGRKD